MELETKRLILRKAQKGDWKDILEGVGDFNVSKMMATIPFPYKKEDAEQFIKDSIKKDKQGRTITFLIQLKLEPKVIGVIALEGINNFDGTATTSSWINKKYWKQGYITEAKIALNDYAFNTLKLNRLKSVVFTENKASNTVQEKVGYVFEGMSRQAKRSKASGKFHDVNTYGLLRKDWKKVRVALLKKYK